MNKFVTGVAVSVLGLAIAGHAEAVPANLVQNGSFESYANGTFTGWTNSGSTGTTPSQYATPIPTNPPASGPYGDVIPQDPFTFSPDPAGVQGAYFVADATAPNGQSLSQNVTLTAGVTYEVGFDYYLTSSGAANPNSFTLRGSIGQQGSIGKSITSATIDGTAPTATWIHASNTFVPGSTGSYVFDFTFISGPAPAKDVVVDLVYVGLPVTPVPEPLSIALVGAGLLGLGLTRRFKRR